MKAVLSIEFAHDSVDGVNFSVRDLHQHIPDAVRQIIVEAALPVGGFLGKSLSNIHQAAVQFIVDGLCLLLGQVLQPPLQFVHIRNTLEALGGPGPQALDAVKARDVLGVSAVLTLHGLYDVFQGNGIVGLPEGAPVPGGGKALLVVVDAAVRLDAGVEFPDPPFIPDAVQRVINSPARGGSVRDRLIDRLAALVLEVCLYLADNAAQTECRFSHAGERSLQLVPISVPQLFQRDMADLVRVIRPQGFDDCPVLFYPVLAVPLVRFALDRGRRNVVPCVLQIGSLETVVIHDLPQQFLLSAIAVQKVLHVIGDAIQVLLEHLVHFAGQFPQPPGNAALCCRVGGVFHLRKGRCPCVSGVDGVLAVCLGVDAPLVHDQRNVPEIGVGYVNPGNSDGGHGEAAQPKVAPQFLLRQIMQGNQVLGFLHRGLEGKLSLDFRAVLGYTLTHRADAISHRGRICAVGLEKSIRFFSVQKNKFFPGFDLILQPRAGVVQTVHAADSVHRGTVHAYVPLNAYQKRLSIAVDVAGHNANAVTLAEGKQRGLQAAVQVFPYSARYIVLPLRGLAKVRNRKGQGERVKPGDVQCRRGFAKVERIAGDHFPIVEHLELLGQRHLRGSFDRKFRLAVRLGGVFVRLQVLRLLCRSLQRRRQLALGGLGLLLLRPGQLADDGPDSVPHLLQQGAVIPVLFNEVVQHLPVVNHAPCVVRSHFVHGLLVGQLYTLGGVGVNASLDAALLLLGNKVPERPVLLGGKLLHPMGHFVPDNSHDRVGVVSFHQHRAAADLCVGGAAAHAVHELHPHAQRLRHAVDLGRRLCGEVHPRLAVHIIHDASALHGLPHKVVVDQAAIVPGALGVRRSLPLSLEGEFRVIPPGNIGRILLRRAELRAVLAADLAHIHAGNARLVVGGEPGVEGVCAHAPVVGRPQRLGPTLTQGCRSALDPANVISLGCHRPLLHRDALGRSRGGSGLLHVRFHAGLHGGRVAACKGLDSGFHSLAALRLAHVVRQ